MIALIRVQAKAAESKAEHRIGTHRKITVKNEGEKKKLGERLCSARLSVALQC